MTTPIDTNQDTHNDTNDGANSGTHDDTNAAHTRPSVNAVAKPLLAAVVIALFVITFVVQAFQIPSGSMEKTLLIGDYVLVDKVHLARGGVWSPLMPYRDIRRGDIIVFHYPVDPSEHFVKRVIGLPGDRIRLREGTVFINGQPLQEEYAIHTVRSLDYYRDNFPTDMDTTGNINTAWHSVLARHVEHGELVVPKDRFFVMGDNRDQSSDSRYWGFVPRQAIVGQPLIVYLSVKEQSMAGVDDPNDKLVRSAHVIAHFWQFARWNRMFHLIR
jgi:signal peptidase I